MTSWDEQICWVVSACRGIQGRQAPGLQNRCRRSERLQGYDIRSEAHQRETSFFVHCISSTSLYSSFSFLFKVSRSQRRTTLTS